MQWKIEPTRWGDRWLDFRYGDELVVIRIVCFIMAFVSIILNVIVDFTSIVHMILSILTIMCIVVFFVLKRLQLDFYKDEEFKMSNLYKRHNISTDSSNYGRQYRIMEKETASATTYSVEVMINPEVWKVVNLPNKSYYNAKGIEDINFAEYVYRWYISAVPVGDNIKVYTSGVQEHSQLLALPAPSIPDEDKRQKGLGVTPEEMENALRSFRAAMLASMVSVQHKKTPNQMRELYDGVAEAEEGIKNKKYTRIEEIEKELKETYNEIQKRQEDDWSDY